MIMKKYPKKTNRKENIVYGVHAVKAILDYQPERARKLYIGRKKDDEELVALARANNVSCEFIERAELERKFALGSQAQGIALSCSSFIYTDLEQIIDRPENKIVVLDSWQDAANLGRAARAALCFGASGLVINKDRAVAVCASAEKAAVGALARLPVAQVANLAMALKKIQKAGFFVYGADESGSVALESCDFAQKTCVVIGQEGEGLRQLTRKYCDVMVKVPMANTDICLNAADSALLFLYELSKNRSVK